MKMIAKIETSKYLKYAGTQKISEIMIFQKLQYAGTQKFSKTSVCDILFFGILKGVKCII